MTIEELLFHPKVVHMPMALGMLVPFISFGVLVAWWRGWFPRRVWVVVVVLQAILVGSALLAIQSGEREEDLVETVVSHRYIHDHEKVAEYFYKASWGVLLTMIAAAAIPRERTALAIALIAVIGTGVVMGLGYQTGKEGGALVYELGAASAYTDPPAKPAEP